MDKNDLIKYSPVRFFEEKSPVLKSGEAGLITAKKGLGKTSILVQFGLDSLLNDKSLVHISFDQESSNVISWYSSVLAEISKKRNVNVKELSEDIMRKRTILNFNQETFTLPKVVKTLKAMLEGGFDIKTLIFDGLNLKAISTEDITCMMDFIKAEKMAAWFSYTSEAAELKNTLESEKIALFTTVAHLAASEQKITLTLLKNGEGKVNLDEKTMLISK